MSRVQRRAIPRGRKWLVLNCGVLEDNSVPGICVKVSILVPQGVCAIQSERRQCWSMFETLFYSSGALDYLLAKGSDC